MTRFSVHETLVSVQRGIARLVLRNPALALADPRDLQSRIAARCGDPAPLSHGDAVRLAAFAVLLVRAVERAERVRVDTGDEAA